MVKAEAVKRGRSRPPNFFVIKILSNKSFDINILHTLFADPAPVGRFEGGGGRGYIANRHSEKKNGSREAARIGTSEFYFSLISTEGRDA